MSGSAWMLGACGMGVGPLALYLKDDGWEVSGWDDATGSPMELQLANGTGARRLERPRFAAHPLRRDSPRHLATNGLRDGGTHKIHTNVLDTKWLEPTWIEPK